MNVSRSEFEEAVRGKRIICYGAGTNALTMLASERFSPFINQVECFIDKDSQKHGRTVTTVNCEFTVEPTERIDTLDESYVVIVTLTDFIKVGDDLSKRNITWFPWTVISVDLKLDNIPKRRVSGKPMLFLLGTPDYINLGDHAITVAEREYLNSNFDDFFELGIHSCHPYALSELKKYVEPGDIIFMQGGGNIGSLWRVCEEVFRSIIKMFPNNAVILFPQSIYYGGSEEEQAYFEESKSIYNSHNNLLICVRDRQSYDFVKHSYTAKCMLLPDMVLTLAADFSLKRTGIGVLLRNDKEKLLPDGYAEKVTEAVNRANEAVRMLTHHPKNLVLNAANRDDFIINGILREYSNCRLVITDRLHGMIFAAITNTPCIAFDNSYHKIFDLYQTWLRDFGGVTVAQPLDPEGLSELIADKLSEESSPINTRFFIDSFSPLTDYISDLIKGE